MADDNRLSHIERQIIALEKDGEVSLKFQDRFEMSLQKMSDVTSHMGELLAVHDAQIRRHDEIIDEHKRDDTLQHKDLVNQIERSIHGVIEKLEKLENSVTSKIGNVVASFNEHDKRIRSLEKITFIGLGLAMLGGIIADKIPWGSIFG